MKGIVYILQSDDGRYYVGSTNDLERRVFQHQRNYTPTTARMKNSRLVFSQEFESLAIARKIERKIKSWKRKDFIEKIIVEGQIGYKN